MPRITFARTLVTGVSRQLTNTEHWTLFYFEQHASQCPSCYNPEEVQKQNRQLCDQGRDLAVAVAGLLFRLRRDGKVVARDEGLHQHVCIEMPAKYEHVSGLFRAIEASKNGILQRPRSLDARFPVRPRIPLHHHAVGPVSAHDYEFDYHPRAAQHALPSAAGYSPRRTSPRQSAAQFPQRWSRESRDSGRWSRGSLYTDDQEVQLQREARERLARYELAMPAPFRYSTTWDR
jgi:hypothetical protein